ncbi:diphthine--ammonia ligase [Candidatus Woesearchaeota archaeon]|nr:MAG: diphthine--ammonia ligase [Candidatus Woesearchaeota archaeon]
MNVAVLYSGGKDSNYAVQYAKEKNWNIQYLLSIKPDRKDCFLFHYATVEHTPLQAKLLGLKHFLIPCTVADPEQEAALVKNFVETMQTSLPVDAVILGGTGLQMTQLKSIQTALQSMHIEVFAAHAGLDHETVFRDMVDKGYEIMITQVASDGLASWLGKKITKENFAQLESDSKKFGFHIGFEGGYADTFVCNMPLFPKKLHIDAFSKVFDDAYCGHVLFNNIEVLDKPVVLDS